MTYKVRWQACPTLGVVSATPTPEGADKIYDEAVRRARVPTRENWFSRTERGIEIRQPSPKWMGGAAEREQVLKYTRYARDQLKKVLRETEKLALLDQRTAATIEWAVERSAKKPAKPTVILELNARDIETLAVQIGENPAFAEIREQLITARANQAVGNPRAYIRVCDAVKALREFFGGTGDDYASALRQLASYLQEGGS